MNLTHLLINYQKISSNTKTKKGKLKSQEEENDVKEKRTKVNMYTIIKLFFQESRANSKKINYWCDCFCFLCTKQQIPRDLYSFRGLRFLDEAACGSLTSGSSGWASSSWSSSSAASSGTISGSFKSSLLFGRGAWACSGSSSAGTSSAVYSSVFLGFWTPYEE